MLTAMLRAVARIILVVALATGVLFVAAAPASAAGGVPDFVFVLDVPQLLNLFVAVIFPVLVGLVTTKVTRSWVKAILLATISLASGFVSALLAAALAGAPFDVIGALLTGVWAWIIAIATHFGFWKPTGVSEAAQDTLITPKTR